MYKYNDNDIALTAFKAVSFQSIVYMLMNLRTMLWFAYNGIRSADILVFGSIMYADANKIKVSNLYKDNCIKNIEA